MKRAFIVKLNDIDNDTLLKLVDQQTWDWINLHKSGKPEEKIGFFKKPIVQWDDLLCPKEIRDRIEKNYFKSGLGSLEKESAFKGVLITIGSWENDRAILAPYLEDCDDFICDGANTKATLDMIEAAKKRGYDVELVNEYTGVMY